jgi:hypothetical protein
MTNLEIRWVEAITLVLAVVALVLACWQAWEARRQTKSLLAIGDSLSTRYLGPFPEYLPALLKLFSAVKEELLICSTIPLHGVFAAPPQWLDMKQQIEQLLSPAEHPKKIVAVFTKEAARQEYLRGQFRNELEDWNNWRAIPKNRKQLQHFAERCRWGNSVDELTKEEFLQLFEVSSEEELRSTFRGATLYESDERHRLNIWIADGKAAVFAFPTMTPQFVNHAFWTSDKKLIDALVNTHLQWQQEADPAHLPPALESKERQKRRR